MRATFLRRPLISVYFIRRTPTVYRSHGVVIIYTVVYCIMVCGKRKLRRSRTKRILITVTIVKKSDESDLLFSALVQRVYTIRAGEKILERIKYQKPTIKRDCTIKFMRRLQRRNGMVLVRHGGVGRVVAEYRYLPLHARAREHTGN